MNLFVVVEGNRDKDLYKKWITYIYPKLTFIFHENDFKQDNFKIISGKGNPQYYSIIKNTFNDLTKPNNVDYLFICVDSEDLEYSDKLKEVKEFIDKECSEIDAEVVIIIQNHCIETWLIGNKKLDISNINNSELTEYRDHYNVNVLDPEGLRSYDERSIGQFTKKYLKLALMENDHRMNYTPSKEYFDQLVKRFEEDNHMKSFGIFLVKMKELSRILNQYKP